MHVVAALLFILMLAPLAPALAQTSVTIDATVVNQTFPFQVEPPAVITVSWSGLQVNMNATTNAPATDNLALSFRDANGTELIILYFKTANSIVLQAPAYGVTTDVILGDWTQLAGLTIRYHGDALRVYDDAGNLLFELTNITASPISDIWAHTPDSATQAFTAGSFTVIAEPDYTALYDPQAVVSVASALMPLLVMIAVFGVVIKMIDRIVGVVGRLGR